MRSHTAHVEGGHLVLDEPTDFPEGAVVRLVAIDMEDELDDEERVRLHASLDAGMAELDAGRRVPGH
jgi:hypothetical protein